MSTSVPQAAPDGPFNFADLRSHGIGRGILKWFLDEPQWWMGWLRTCWPILHIPCIRWAMLTRFEHVQEALAHEDIFQVQFDRRMQKLLRGPSFVLALQNGVEYEHQRRQLMQVFKLEDIEAIIAPRSADSATRIVAECGGQIDAIEGLLTLVPTQLCESYYGIKIPEKKLFAQCLIAISAYVFGWPSEKSERNAEVARKAAAYIRKLIEQAISDVKATMDRSTTIVARLVGMQEGGACGPDDELIRAELFGMLVGFVPTNTIASGNVLEMLLRRKEFREQAQAAACDDNDELLWRCLFETMRFKPINPGLFRRCEKTYTIAEGSSAAKRIPKGTWLLVSTQSAMFDKRAVVEPKKFRPDRPTHESMVFGYGLHWCIGAFLAKAQITQTFKPLLKRDRLERAGRLQTVGIIPTNLKVTFKP